MKISVVIPTYNEQDGIEECIQSIFRNTFLPHEIIICDGMSDDNTKQIAENLDVTVLENKKRIASAGRNLGIEHASGDIIAFTDGDCIADKNWLLEFNKAFKDDEELIGIGGKVIPASPRNDIEEFWGNISLRVIMSFPDEAYFIKTRTLNDAFITANCAYRKEALQNVGGFDDWFGNNAEDVDLSWRLLKSGTKLRYIPESVIFARSPTTMKAVMKKSFRNGVSSSKLEKRHSGKYFTFDKTIHILLWKNIFQMLLFKNGARRNLMQLSAHLWGKIIGSIRCGIINI